VAVAEEVESIVQLPSEPKQIPTATKIRSTLLMSSQKTLREEELFTAYEAALPSEHRDAILHLTTPAWLDIELGMSHYTACDRLGLSPIRIGEVGQRVGMHAQGTFLGVALAIARGAGATPWTAMKQARRIWERAFVGGAIGVNRVGPTEARVDVFALPIARIDYCRHALRGLLQGVTSLLTKSAHVREIPLVPRDDDRMSFKITWV